MRMDLGFLEKKIDLKIPHLVAEILGKNQVSFFLGHPVLILCNYWRELKEKALFFGTRIIFIRQPRWLIFNLNIFTIFLPICVDKLNLNKTEKAFNLKVGHSP